MEYFLKNSIGYRINKAANTINNRMNKILFAYDIAVEQRATLEIIKFEKNVNQTTIAQLLGKDKTTISRSLNALEKKGLISKKDILSDKRMNAITLTLKGEALLEQSLKEVEAFRKQLGCSLCEEELERLFNTLDLLCENVKE